MEIAKKRIKKKSNGIIHVQLCGLIRPHMEDIRNIAKRHTLFLMEDAS
ncbi:DegT/DnrJ/EryC1/StrS family aminotransferase, partial [Candidatus Peregrinibacteria bacterium]|nr:DegT/DnrJ/EryC1/StrS family aminotransferase [Candidatus Peregrinibacteria bacterium]